MSGDEEPIANTPTPDVVAELLHTVLKLRADIITEAAVPQDLLAAVHLNHVAGTRNLLHYLALRRRDLRPLQPQLAAVGLSSLGRAESSVLATIDAVLGALHHLAEAPRTPLAAASFEEFTHGQRLLADHADALFGPPSPGLGVRIMVTMPSEAARDYALVRDLVQEGMNCMRINCAHDDATAWAAMIAHLRRAEEETGRRCRVAMDLAGPKLRTGPLEPGPSVLRVRPQRDELGRVVVPARIRLVPEGRSAPGVPVPPAWLACLIPGDRITLEDARGAQREFFVTAANADAIDVESVKTVYLVPGTILQHEPVHAGRAGSTATVGALTPRSSSLILKPGDRLIVTRNQNPGRQAVLDSDRSVVEPARIGCTIPEVFDDVRSGESIWFDDGKIGGVIEAVETERVLVSITQTRSGGGKLQPDKGINLPDSRLRLSALTPKDVEDLAFAAVHADVLELSFANTSDDVAELQKVLKRLTDRPPAIVLKIETQRGFENLPGMLLTAMQSPRCGVMIARGDLAVECGFERLAEIQEEILWICEAAHIPVIWATQVLETLAREGMPSRAEITDAAMGHRAECVMLNKGPYVVRAVRVLAGILRRMQEHQAKKRPMLRALRLASRFPVALPET